jgi:hypothetical protein
VSLQIVLRSEVTAWVVGAVGVAVVATLAFSWLGWLGIGLVGLLGLVITVRITLLGEHAVMDSGFGTGPVGLLAKQMEEQRMQSSPEQKAAIAAERAQRKRLIYTINTGFIGMTALGFGLFALHQL